MLSRGISDATIALVLKQIDIETNSYCFFSQMHFVYKIISIRVLHKQTLKPQTFWHENSEFYLIPKSKSNQIAHYYLTRKSFEFEH